MAGLGDTIYQRPCIAGMLEDGWGPIYYRTPWPELFEDMPDVRPVYFDRLANRCGRASMDAWPGPWWPAPELKERNLRYLCARPGVSYVDELCHNSGLERAPGLWSYSMSLPEFDGPDHGSRVAVLRPATVRREWAAPARNPHPGYLNAAAAMLRERAYTVVLVANLEDGSEWLAEAELPEHDVAYLHGELETRELLGLIRQSAVGVGGVGFLLPAAMAYHRPAVMIGGGNGRHQAPEYTAPPRIPQSDRVAWLLPDHYCRCINRMHAGCDKRIARFPERFIAALHEVGA